MPVSIRTCKNCGATFDAILYADQSVYCEKCRGVAEFAAEMKDDVVDIPDDDYIPGVPTEDDTLAGTAIDDDIFAQIDDIFAAADPRLGSAPKIIDEIQTRRKKR